MAFAASTDEARPVLMGVLVTVEKDTITMAAADGFRLSVRKATLSTPGPAARFSAIIPARALSELARIASDGEQMISMVLPKGRGQVVFRVKDAELVSQLIDGTFPDYQQIIPRSYKSRTLVSTAALLKACKQAEIFAREGSNVARIEHQSIHRGTNAERNGNIGGHPKKPARMRPSSKRRWTAIGLLIAFNVKFMREVLEVIKTPNVALETSAANAPGVVRPVGDESFTARHHADASGLGVDVIARPEV